jgi:hypothetical protein
MYVKPHLRKKPTPPAPPAPRTTHRGVPYQVVEESGVFRWRVLPANPGLHAYEYSVPHGFRPTREAAEAAVKAAIDTQLDA